MTETQVGSGGVERLPLVLAEPVFERGHVFAKSFVGSLG
jgi:hypothetical protein